MDYTVLARRFRPQAFGEVVGQEMVAQALRNAISADRVAHAYLFTGARGVGKTSMARILAKSLNCPNSQDGNPCNACEVCQSISTGNDVDVLEIDGASNRGIEDIRALRSNVNVKSMRSRYKIYIIDEVHMLTREAFNALLKTLEEPPPNVKFIFCTTEPHKLPDTILSRCQRFDFGTIATASIMNRLTEIAAAEGVQVEPAAVELVARRAAGSMRDSQSLFDQLLAFGGPSIVAADVHRLLGTASDERLTELVAALLDRRRDIALDLFNASLQSGVQLSELTDQLLSYLRDLMVLAAGAKEVALQSVSEESRATLAIQAESCGLHKILAALQILAEAKLRMKGVNYGRSLAELALVRISLLEDLDQLSQLVQQLQTGQSPTLAAGKTAIRTEPAANERRLAAPAPSTPTDSQKKNDSVSTAVGSSSVLGTEPPVEQQNVIPLEPGNENNILTQLISQLSDMAKSHARNIASIAISGPNQLVLSFPKSYHLSKQHLERPDQLARLEKTLETIVGKPVRVTFRVLEPAEAAPESLPTPAVVREEQQNRRGDAANDPLVKKAMSEFGATVVRVEQVGT